MTELEAASRAYREGRKRRGQCPECEAVMINGVYCHERGCPARREAAVDSWSYAPADGLSDD